MNVGFDYKLTNIPGPAAYIYRTTTTTKTRVLMSSIQLEFIGSFLYQNGSTNSTMHSSGTIVVIPW